jgi:3-oxoacyl-[acyl-carrier-protein] synthase III
METSAARSFTSAKCLRPVKIAGLSTYVPPRVLSNHDLERMVQTTDEWILQRTGIRERHIVDAGVATSDLAKEAALGALSQAGLTPDDIGFIVVGTTTPDTIFPSTACLLQDKIGAKRAWGFDLGAACSGFTYALTTGMQMVATGAHEHALVVGADVMSSIIDYTDRTTCVLFGDGAGAVVLRPAEEPGVIGSVLGADGTAAEILQMPAGGTAMPASEATVRAHDHSIRMPNGREVFRRAVIEMASACRELLDKSGYTPDDVDLLIPHQANARIMRAVAERLGITGDRAVVDVEEVGTTSAASIPIALDRAWHAGRVPADGLVLLTSFGGGLAWGANLLRWTARERPA